MIQEVVKADLLGNDLVNLPKNWLWMKLGDIARTTSGGTPSRRNPEYFIGSIPWVKSGELDDGWLYDTEEKISQEAIEKSSAKKFSKGTLLMAMYGATVGKLGILGIEAATNQAICSIFPKDFLDRDFLFYYLKSIRPTLLGQSFGGAQPNISQTVIKAIPVPVPTDVNIQRQIVVRIEALLAEVRSSRELLDEMRRDCDRVINAALIQTFQDLATKYEPESLEQHIEHLTSGSRGWSKYANPSNVGPLFIRVGNVGFSRLNLTDIERLNLPPNLREAERTKVAAEDVLITVTGTIGRCCVVPANLEEAYINQHTALVRPTDGLNPRYLMWFVLSPSGGGAQTAAMQYGQTKPGLNLTNIRNLQLPVPNKLVQRQIVSYLDTLQSEVDEMLNLLEQDAKTLNLLEQSILERAFRGEL